MDEEPVAIIECSRCGLEIPFDRFDAERWIVRYAWDDEALFVCASCQRSDERQIQDLLQDDQGG